MFTVPLKPELIPSQQKRKFQNREVYGRVQVLQTYKFVSRDFSNNKNSCHDLEQICAEGVPGGQIKADQWEAEVYAPTGG